MNIKLVAVLLFSQFLVPGAPPPDQAAARRADRLGSAALAMVRAEWAVSHEGREAAPGFAEADKAFTDLVKRLDSGRFSDWVATGKGQWANPIERIVSVAEKLPAAREADAAAGLLTAFERRKQITSRWTAGKLDAYAAALLVILQDRGEIRMKLGLVDMLLEIQAPVMLADLGLSRSDTTRLRRLASDAAKATDVRNYPAAAGDFFRVMVQLDDLGGRFGHRSNEKDLADRLMASSQFRAIRDRVASLAPATICFFGDSQTDNRHWSSPAHYPAILAEIFQRVNPKVKVINAGVGGDDSGEGLARIDKDVLAHHPDICFVLFGGNDCNYHGGSQPAVSPGQFHSNISEITVKLRAAGCKPVLMTYPLGPIKDPRERQTLARMNQELKRVRHEYDAGWLPIARLIDRADLRWMFAVDGIHFSPEAHEKISLAILQYLVNHPAPGARSGG